MPRPLGPMTGRIEAFIRMEARGEAPDDIIKAIFNVDPSELTPEEKNKYYQQMWRWRHRPDAQEVWEDEVRQFVRRCVPAAMGRINRQLNDSNGWLANKAANDVLGLAKAVTIFAPDEKAIKVQFDGMPEIGTPDEAE